MSCELISLLQLTTGHRRQWLCHVQGRVILISSEAGITVKSSMLHYSVSKTAQVSLGQGLAQLTAGSRVTVNSVLVGPTWTEGVDAYLEGIAAKTGEGRQWVGGGMWGPCWAIRHGSAQMFHVKFG